jgi:glycine oxidase
MIIQNEADVIIVGGGVIGCSIAFHAQQAGLRCVVLERGVIGCGSSQAGAGMLGAQVEMTSPGPMYELGIASRSQFPELSRQIKEISRIDIEYQDHGILRIAANEQETETLKSRIKWQQSYGHKAEWLSPDTIHDMTKGKLHAPYGGVYFPDDHQVRNPPYIRGLAESARRLGATIHEHTEVTGFLLSQERVIGVTTTNGNWYGHYTVLAGGAYSADIGKKLELSIPVFPVKGQAILTKGVYPIDSIAYSHGCYLVPKLTGQVYIGASEQPHTSDTRPSLGVLSRLLMQAIQLVPEVETFEFAKSLTGLRPGSADSLPILGPVSGYPGLLLATGHFRNGVLLSPITGALICEYIQTGDISPLLSPFLLERFKQ